MMRRRLIYLTLARAEWDDLARELSSLPQTSESCGSAIAALEDSLAGAESDPDQLVTLAQPSIQWSPLIFALSLHVLYSPSLLPIAERLRNQMEMQAKGIEGAVYPDEEGEGLQWGRVAVDSCRGIVSTN